MDEAGYGPSMGPLTICATAWRVPISFNADEMTRLLEPEFQAKPIKPSSTHVPIGDSKKIHRDKLAVEGLMLGARFLCFAVNGSEPTNGDYRIDSFANQDLDRLSKVPWYAKRGSCNSSSLDQLVPNYHDYFKAAMSKLGNHDVELVGIKTRIIDEIEFNRQVDRTGNKSTILSESSLQIVREVITELSNPEEDIEVYCDKHGGRNRYHGLLTFMFDQVWFEIEIESRNCSRYSSNWARHAMRFQFKVDGDSMFPSAAASIIAKCTREELMERLNGYWKSKVTGGVKATAGYYVDATRFAKQIEATAIELGMTRDLWWRKK